MTKVQLAAERLVKQHGGLRAAARASGLDHAYLHRLIRGKKQNPSDEVLAALGLVKHVTYRRTEAQA